jgi:hypothetical protein
VLVADPPCGRYSAELCCGDEGDCLKQIAPVIQTRAQKESAVIAELRLVGHDKKSPIELRLFAIPLLYMFLTTAELDSVSIRRTYARMAVRYMD